MSDTPQQPEIPAALPAVITHAGERLPIVDGAGSRMFSSLPMESLRERAKVASMMAGELPALNDQVNRTIVVSDMIITTVEKQDDKTGEVMTLPYVILIDRNGSAYCTFGKVPCNSLTRLMATMGRPPWGPPLPLKVVSWTGGAERKSVQLVLDFEAYCLQLDEPAKPKQSRK